MKILVLFILVLSVLAENKVKRHDPTEYIETLVSKTPIESHKLGRYADHAEHVVDYGRHRSTLIPEKEAFLYRGKEEYEDWDDNHINVVGLGKNDREEMVRPCYLDNWRCIRQFFAKNSECKPAYGPVSDPVYVKRHTMHFPHANLSLTLTRTQMSGLRRTKISELYYNPRTGNVVLGLSVRKLNISSPSGYFRYKKPKKESTVLHDFISMELSGTITAVIPQIPKLRLDLSEIRFSIGVTAVPYVVGPNAVNNDKEVQASYGQLTGNIVATLSELTFILGQFLGALYIQENICDFGIKIFSF